MFEFNEFIGEETLEKEYKSFSLHKTGAPFDIRKAEYYCETNLFEFDELVFANIKKYIQYIPKYACGFWNAGIKGEFYIGADDYGFIKGIPLTIGTSINKDWLQTYIVDVIQKNVRFKNGSSFPITISVDIIPVSNPEKENGTHPQYERYLKKKKEFLDDYQDFIIAYKYWQKKYEFVNMKLTDIVNNPINRALLIKYVEASVDRNETALQLLYDPTFLLPYLSGEDIKYLKYDKDSVFYWVTTMKDELCKEYKRDKPTFIKRFKQQSVPFNLLVSLSEMVPYWVDSIHLFVIRVTFHTNYFDKSPFSYNNGTQWIICNRIIDPSGNHPICNPQ